MGRLLVVAVLAGTSLLASCGNSQPRASGDGNGRYRWRVEFTVEDRNPGSLTTFVRAFTLDGIADPHNHRYWLRLHQTAPEPQVTEQLVFAHERQYVQRRTTWCSTSEANGTLARFAQAVDQPSIDPVHWWHVLRDGESSTLIAVTRYFEIPIGQGLTAVVRRDGETLRATLSGGLPARAKDVLTFSDYGQAPEVVAPAKAIACPPTGSD